MTSRSKKAIFGIVTLILTIAVCFVILEFVFARFYYSDVYQISLVEFDPVVGWRYKPGTYRVKPPGSFTKHEIYINDLGLRNRDISKDRGDNVKRIVILGDSFVFARSTPTEELFTIQLEDMLNRGSPDDSVEVINAGIAGFGTAQQLMLIRELAAEGVVADIYLLMAFTNDPLDNARRFYHTLAENRAQPAFVLDSDGELVLQYAPEKRDSGVNESPVPERAFGRTRIAQVLQIRLGSYVQTKPGLLRFLNNLGMNLELPCMPGVVNAWYRDDILTDGIPLMKTLMKEIKAQAEAYDSKLLVCLIPSQFQVYPDVYRLLLKKSFPESELVEALLADTERPQRVVGEICSELRIPFLDLLPTMRKHNDRALYIAAEGHFSNDAHGIVARSLADFIGEHTDWKATRTDISRGTNWDMD